MKYKELPSVDVLRNKYAYNPETGELTHTIGQHKGRPVGSISSVGYLRTISNGITYKVHRIIWKMQTGEDPGQLTIDHINRNKVDNRWENLRLATVSMQSYNKPSNNVCRTRTSWQGVIKHKGKRYTKGNKCPLLCRVWVLDKRKELGIDS